MTQIAEKLTLQALRIVDRFPGQSTPQNAERNVHKLRLILQRVLRESNVSIVS